MLDHVGIEIAIKKFIEHNKKDILGEDFINASFVVVVDETVFTDYEPFFEIFREKINPSIKEWLKEKGYRSISGVSISFEKGHPKKKDYEIQSLLPPDSNSEVSSAMPCRRKPNMSIESFAARKKIKRGATMEISIQKVNLVNTATGDAFVLPSESIIIGRHKGCDIHLDDETISEIHCGIFMKNRKVIIEDMGSTNGTRLNRQMVEKAALRGGDKIQLGSVELLFNE
jgi:hypothetical protein